MLGVTSTRCGRARLRWMLAVLLLVGSSLALAATSFAEPTQGARADATCQGVLGEASKYGSSVEFLDAQATSAGAVARWQEQRHAPDVSGLVSPLRMRDPTESVVVCLFSGTFVTPHPPELPPHNILRLLVLADGSVLLDSAGYQGTIDREAPSDQ